MRAFGVVCQSLSLLTCLVFLPRQLEPQSSRLLSKTSTLPISGEHAESTSGRHTFSLGELPLQFETNVGQAASQARFLARGGGYTLLITPDGLVLNFSRGRDNSAPRISMRLLGTQPGDLAGRDQTETRTNYYIGKDPSSWHLNVPSYRSVEYRGIYKGIDLIYHGSGSRLEYDFVISPGADPGRIRMRFDGLKPSMKGKDLSFGDDSPVSIRALNAFQVIRGEKKAVDADWQIQGDQASIHLGPYDREHELVIDPIISYGTYIGGSGSESAVSIVPASTANVFYVALASNSASLSEPAQEAGQTAAINPNANGTDTLILELDTTGDSLSPLSASVIRKRPSPLGIILPPPDCSTVPCATLTASPTTIVSGGTSTLTWSSTNSTSCTASGGWTGTEATSGSLTVSPVTATTYTLTCAGAGIASLPASATITIAPTVLIKSATYIGGSGGATVPTSMAADSAFNLYVTGTTTTSTSLPQMGTQLCSSACPSFVAKLNSSLALQYSSGLPVTSSNGIAVDSDQDIYLTGKATAGSLTIPSADSAFQSKVTTGSVLTGGSHAFLMEIDSNGNILFASNIGGSGSDQGTSIAVSGTSVYVAGQTSSANLPTTPGVAQAQYAGPGTGTGCPATSNLGTGCLLSLGAQQPVSLNGDAFVVAAQNLSTDPALTFSTYLGGSGDDYASSIAVDPFGNIVAVGSTTSVFPSSLVSPLTFYTTTTVTSGGNSTTTVTSNQTTSIDALGSQLGFVYGLSSNGSARFLNLLGGASGDIATGASVAVDSAGVIYVVGSTNSIESSGAFLGSDVAVADYDLPSSGTHAFLVQIDPTGADLLEATVAGGSQTDQANAIALSPGFASLVGSTSSTSPPPSPSVSCTSPADFFCSAYLSLAPEPAQGANEGFFAQEQTTAFCNLSPTGQVGSSLVISGPCSPGTTAGFLSGTVTDSNGAHTLTPTQFTITSSSLGSVSFDLSPYSGPITLNLTFSGFTPVGAGGEPCDTQNGDINCPIVTNCPPGRVCIQGANSTITYGGGLGTLFSTSNTPLTVSISCESANCTYNSVPNAVIAGQAVSLSAAVTSGIPNTVTWAPANAPQGKLIPPPSPSTSATFTAGLTGGSTTITATSVADRITTGTIQLATIETPALALAVTNSPPIAYGQPVSVSVAASGNYATPSGPITYEVDNGTPVVANLSSSGATLITLTGLSVGQHSLSVSYPGNYPAGGFFAPAASTMEFNINPALLTVQAANASVTYGQLIPALTSYTITGFENGDGQSAVSGSATETTSATSSSASGDYPITFSVEGLTAANYSFNYVNGSLTITSLGTAPPAPSISPAGGYYTAPQTVTLADSVSSAKLYYTTNGNPPSTSSTPYSGPFTVGSSSTVTAIATASGYDNDVSAPANAAFTLAQPSLSTASLAFGSIVQGQSSTAQTVVFTNQGLNQLTNVTLSISGSNSGDFVLNPAPTCGLSVAAGSNCSIAVVFSPSGGGARSATLSVGYAGIGSPQSVSLGGAGLEPLLITSSASQLIAGTTVQFTANQPAVWTASAGTISSSGFYTSPSQPPSPALVTITATSTAYAQLVATLAMTIVPAPAISVPATTTLAAGQSTSISLSIGAGTGIAGESYALVCTPASLPTNVSCVFNPNPIVDAVGGVSGTLQLTSNALTSKAPERQLPQRSFPIRGSIVAAACCCIAGIRRKLWEKGRILIAVILACAALLGVDACGTGGSFKVASQPEYVTGIYTINVAVIGASTGAPDFNQTVTTFPVNVTIK